MKCGVRQDFKKSDLAKIGSFAQGNLQKFSEVGIAGIRKGKTVATEYRVGTGPSACGKHFLH